MLQPFKKITMKKFKIACIGTFLFLMNSSLYAQWEARTTLYYNGNEVTGNEIKEVYVADCNSAMLILKHYNWAYGYDNDWSFSIYRDSKLIQNVRNTRVRDNYIRIPISIASGLYSVDIWISGNQVVYGYLISVTNNSNSFPNIDFCGSSHHGMYGFGVSQGWRKYDFPVMMADMDGSGTSDIVGFAAHGMDLALNQGGNWAYAPGISGNYGFNQGFNGSNSIRTTAKLNYDNRADVLVFGPGATESLFSNPNGGFTFASSTNWFSGATGWNNNHHERLVADVNGDGLDDIIGFGYVSTQVSAANGNGGFFPLTSFNDLAYNQNWSKERHVRTMANVNNDGRADIVAFGQNKTYVYVYDRATTSYVLRNEIDDFHYAAGYRVDEHVRLLRDVNGDGMDDIVAFANDGVRVALANATGYGDATYWIHDYGKFYGWRNARHPRLMGDINGDGMADIVGFFEDGIWASLSTGYSFTCPETHSGEFSIAEGFTVEDHPRWLADIDGDGRMEIVANSNSSIQYFNCNSSAPTFRANNPKSEVKDAEKPNVSVYPTLLENDLSVYVTGAKAGSQLSIVDMTGKLILTAQLTGSENEKVDLAHLITSGMYFVRIVNDQGVLDMSDKIVVR
jgi:hypothetical protein